MRSPDAPSDPECEHQSNRLLIIFPGALGDLLCLGPAIRAVVRRHPGTSIELMARTELARFAVGRMGVSRAESIDRREVAALFSEGPELTESARFFGQFGRILSFFASQDRRFRDGLRAAAGTSAVSFHPFRPEVPGHVAAAYLNEIGEPGAPLDSHLELISEDLEGASTALAGLGLRDSPFVLLFPGSGGRHKNWPAENFAILANAIRPKANPLFVLGPAEQDLRQTLVPMLEKERISYLRELSLGTVAGLARLAAGFVGNDSGVSHLAAACGAPGVAIFGPSEPARWRPLGRVEVIRSENLSELTPADVASTLCSMWPDRI
jgi:heptosyltransferase-3